MGEIKPIIGLEEGWNIKIKAAALDKLEAIFDAGFLQKSKLFTNAEYSNVYTTCYDMCTQKNPFNWSEQLYERHGETISTYLEMSVLPQLRNKKDEFLLNEFVKRGENHKIMNKWYKKFFTYLDRYHVIYRNLPSLDEAGKRYFKLIVFDAIKSDVTETMLSLINKERDDRIINHSLLRSCVEIYESMGLGSLDAYIFDFEAPFLESSRRFYSGKAQEWIQGDTTPEYLIKVEKALNEERARVTAYLNKETEPKLLKVMHEELLQKKANELLEKEGSGCKVLLVNEMYTDLSRLFRLFTFVPDVLQFVAEILRSHIVESGNVKVSHRLQRMNNGDSSNSSSSEAKAGPDIASDDSFIRDLLIMHDKFLLLVDKQFESHSLFHKALKNAMSEIVNRDVGRYKTAELISSYCDRLLMKPGSNADKLSSDEIEESLEKTVQLFSYLTDKDLFAEIYRNQMAKRLLNQRSASDEMERVMIGKLKLRCGAQYTSKMEGMLNDLSIGAEHASEFKRHLQSAPRLGPSQVEFDVQVLTTGYWPYFKTFDVSLPPVMQHYCQVFSDYYGTKTNHRKLQWTYSLGTVVIKTTIQKRTYNIQLTVPQAVVLMAFNDSTSNNPNSYPVQSTTESSSSDNSTMSFVTLQEMTGMPDFVMKRVLHSLCFGKFRILKRIQNEPVAASVASAAKTDSSKMIVDEEGGAAQSAVKEGGKEEVKGGGAVVKTTDSYKINELFSNDRTAFRIPIASLDDLQNSSKRVEEDRTVAIEAAIVRIMKARKTLAHQQLVAEVLSHLSFFRPDPKVVKRRIETLIEREYLERDANNPSVYNYLA